LFQNLITKSLTPNDYQWGYIPFSFGRHVPRQGAQYERHFICGKPRLRRWLQRPLRLSHRLDSVPRVALYSSPRHPPASPARRRDKSRSLFVATSPGWLTNSPAWQ
jgi:hypothetical protein